MGLHSDSAHDNVLSHYPSMKHLHPYWRLEYIESNLREEKGSNPFKELPNSTDDKAARILYRGPHAYLVLNIFPYNPGHLLAVPYKEVDSLEKLSAEERADLMETVVKGQDLLTKAISPQGFNVGFNFGCAAGAGIPKHLHCHIVPRWEGDSNFMPVIGQTRILPSALDTLWERLKEFTD